MAVLRPWEQRPGPQSTLRFEAVFDREHDRYLVVVVGWDGHHHVHSALVHIDVIDGKLWTAARLEHHGIPAAQRMPVIRVYDIFNPAAAGRSLLPTEHVGPVTSATIIPTQPRMVYVGHEEGYISMWELDTEDGFPACVEVMKVSVSDVLSIEGVNDRLWAGSRNGMISAYSVTQRPWVVTNCWSAHAGVPVLKLSVNYFAVPHVGRLCVASVGRDDHMRIWDGLLGSDWIGERYDSMGLHKRF